MTLNWLNFKRSMHYLTFISLLTFISTASIAGIYKWTDAEGNVHYGQQRPRDASSEKMNVPRYAPANTSTYKRPGQKTSDPESKNTPTDNPKSTAHEPEEIKLTRAEKKRRLTECNEIRKNLALMEARGRIRSVDKEGNTRYLTQKEKEARMSKSKKTLAESCK